MRILILNWRDIHNPRAGGADLLTHEMALRWVQNGHHVTLFTASYPNATSEEVIDGIHIIRRGTWWSVYPLALLYYFIRLRATTDVIIDEVHWFPFFARLYAPHKTILLACEVATSLFSRLYPAPLAQFWQMIESFYLWLYREVPTMVISPSTKQALMNRGFPEKNITIIPMGLTIPSSARIMKKTKQPSLLFLGRLNTLKGAMDALQAFVIIKKRMPDAIMQFAGSGAEEYVAAMKAIVRENGLSDSVHFYGFVSEKEKFKLLAQAHVLVVPSVHEGWGLVVPEANYVGTPAVAYRVAGLQDVVHDGKTGLLTDPDPDALARACLSLLEDRSRYAKIVREAQKSAHLYDWDNTAKQALAFIKKHI